MNETTQSSNLKKKKKTKLVLRILLWLVVIGAMIGSISAGAVVGYISALVKDDPVRDSKLVHEKIDENSETGFVYFANDLVIGQLRADEDRRFVHLKDVPDMIKQAFFAIEDNRFYDHIGIDWFGLVRAVKQKAMNDDVQTGGSTITQQLARRVFLSLERSSTRKAKEIFLSLRLERLLSKDEILEAYLNKIPFGQGSSGYNLLGISAAAKGLFGKDKLTDLNIAQCAYLAGLPQQPSNFSAFNNKGTFEATKFTRAIQRQHLVLSRMLEEQRISKDEYDQAMAFDVKTSLAKSEQKAYNTYPWLMLEAEKQAAEIILREQHKDNLASWTVDEYNEALKEEMDQLPRQGYRIYTTIDQQVYDAMHRVAANPKNFGKDNFATGKIEQTGAMLIESKTGAIIGMVEGRDYKIEQLNHATQAFRQPGSSMKPLGAYIPAMDQGLIQPASIIDDSPIIMEDGVKGFHIPVNHDGKYHGLITAREALNQSYNIPALKVFLNMVGIKQAWNFVRKLGITSLTKEDDYSQTGVIGGLTQGVTVKEMTNAYSSIPNGGTFVPAFMISKIVDAHGRSIYEHPSVGSQVFSKQTAFLITDMLRTVIDNGTANIIKSKYKFNGKVPIAGKTGTTTDNTDVWFIGFTPDVTLGVWVGFDKPVFKLSKADGGTTRAKVLWAKLMNEILNTRKEWTKTDKQFAAPEKVTQMTVSSVSGLLPNDYVKQANKLVTDWFNQAFVPTTEDQTMIPMKVTFNHGIPVLPLSNTPDDFTKSSIMVKREENFSEQFKKIDELLKTLPDNDPKIEKKPLKEYIPLDIANAAPNTVDPRVDDGTIPPTPVMSTIEQGKPLISVRFQSSGEPADLLGYRLYQSVDGGGFERVTGKVVFAGNETAFNIKADTASFIEYAVTSVDVAGNESPLSEAILYNP